MIIFLLRKVLIGIYLIYYLILILYIFYIKINFKEEYNFKNKEEISKINFKKNKKIRNQLYFS
jgi:hypothetical protein